MTVSIRLAGYLIGTRARTSSTSATRPGAGSTSRTRSAPHPPTRCAASSSRPPTLATPTTDERNRNGNPDRRQRRPPFAVGGDDREPLPSTAPPDRGARPPDGEYAARLLVPASQMVRLDPVAVVADPTVTVEVDERPADDPTLVSCALPNDRAVRISGPDESVSPRWVASPTRWITASTPPTRGRSSADHQEPGRGRGLSQRSRVGPGEDSTRRLRRSRGGGGAGRRRWRRRRRDDRFRETLGSRRGRGRRV